MGLLIPPPLRYERFRRLFDVVDYLKSKKCEIKEASSGEIHTHCFFHGEEENKNGRLYIQTEDPDKYGVFHCFVCGASGGINRIRAHFGDEPLQLESDGVYNRIYECAVNYYHEALYSSDSNFEGYTYLTEERGFDDDTIERAKLGYADGKLGTFLLQEGFSPEEIQASGLQKKDGSDFFFKGMIIKPYMKYGHVQNIRGKVRGGKVFQIAGTQSMLYGLDSIRGESTVYVAEGAFDALMLQQMGFPTIGVPGVQTWKDEWSDLLEDAKRIYIVFDNDAAGNSGAEKLSQRLGPRCRIVEIPVKGYDVTDYVMKAGKTVDDFKFLFSKSKGGLLVSPLQMYEEWMHVEGNPNPNGLKFGIQGLDFAIPTGLLPAQVMTLISRSGTGKSVFAINMMYRMKTVKPDLKVLFLSLEMTRNEVFHRLHLVNSFYNPGVTPYETAMEWSDNLVFVDANRVTQDQLVDCIDQSVYEMSEDLDLCIVDYLGYYARSFVGDKREQVTESIMGLKEVAKMYKLPIFAPHQANRSGDLGGELTYDMAKDSSTVEETSDIMLSMWRPFQGEITKNYGEQSAHEGTIHQRILKSRNGTIGQAIDYCMSPLTLAMVPVQDPLYNRALREFTYRDAGDTWRQAVERHRTGSMDL